MFPTNINFFVAFHGQGSMKMISQPKQEEQGLTWGKFFHDALLPYQQMIDNPIYPKKLRRDLKAQVTYTRMLSMFFQMELQQGRDDQKYRDRLSQLLQSIEQLAQELDKSIK